MKIGKIKTAMSIAHAAQDHVHIVGPHGMGKTEIVKEWAKDNDYHLEVLQLPILEVSDLVGMPHIEDTKEGLQTTWAAPGWINRIHKANNEGKHAVIFLDELGRASVDVRQAALQLVLEGKINEHTLGELNTLKSLMVVADNPSDGDYDVAEFDPALEDRFQSYVVEPDLTAWLKYAAKVGVSEIITSYLAEFGEKLHYIPDGEDDKGATPRAWKKLSDGLAVIDSSGDDSFKFQLILSKVGKTVGSNFFHYLNNYINVVKPEDIQKLVGKGTNGTKVAQKKLAKKLEKLTKDIEVISAGELANKLAKIAMTAQTEDKQLAEETVVMFLASLNLETAAGIVKSWAKSDDKELEEFYLKPLQKAQGWAETDKMNQKWFLRELITLSTK